MSDDLITQEILPPEEDGPAIDLIVIYNPLDRTDRTLAKLDWQPEKALIKYLDGLPEEVDWSVSINGKPIDRDKWEVIYPNQNDSLVIMPWAHGGGGSGGKNIFAMIAMVVIAAVALYVTAGQAAWLLGPVLGTGFGAAMVGMGITVAGGLLVTALTPSAKPSNPLAPSDGSDNSLVYGIDGPKNTSSEDVCVPLVYGTFRMAGNIVDERVDNVGSATQVLYMRMIVSEGPIDGFNEGVTGPDSFLIEQQKKANYTNVSYDYRLGYDDQPISPWFNVVSRMINQGARLDAAAYFTYTTESPCQALRVDFVLPNGLFGLDHQGNIISANVGWNLEWSPAGLNQWNVFPQAGYAQSAVQQIGGQPAGNWYVISPAVSGEFVLVLGQRSAFRFSVQQDNLPMGLYDIRCIRTNAENTSGVVSDQLYISDVSEILYEQVAYNFTAWYALYVVLSNQLDHIPRATVEVRGRIVPQYDAKGNQIAYAYSEWPSDIVLDILMNKRVGGGVAAPRIDFAAFYKWRTFCIANNLRFNGVFADASNIWDACQVVLRIGHANLTMVGTTFSVVIDSVDLPVQVFNMGNIVKGSFQINWLDLSNRANEVDVTYYDKNDYYNQHTIRVIDYDALAAGQPQRASQMTLVGITDAQTAFNEGWYQLNQNKYILQTCQFDVQVEAIGATLGDIISVQHDMPAWGAGGRIETGSTATVINLDRPVTMSDNQNYSFMIVHDAIARQSNVSLVTANGRSLFVLGSPPAYTFKRVQWTRFSDGKLFDWGVSSVANSAPYTEIILDTDVTASLIGAGSLISLWDTDVAESVNVVYNEGEQTAITLATPLSVTPTTYSKYMFGAVGLTSKPFRIKQITGSQDLVRTIQCFEYNPSIYGPPSAAAPTPDYSSLSTGIGQVRNLSAVEHVVYVGGLPNSEIQVNWTTPLDGTYAGANVSVWTNSFAVPNIYAVRGGATTVTIKANQNDQLTIRASAVAPDGTIAAAGLAPSVTVVAEGLTLPPDDVVDFTVEKIAGGLEFDWTAEAYMKYEIRQGDSWDDGVPVLTNFSGNRSVFQKNTSGVYTWWIKAINQLGVYSTNPASVGLTLIGPAAVFGFQAVQNGTQIIFGWRANTEADIAEYELREGPNWNSATYVAQVRTTRYMMPNDVPGTRIFWIKAIDSAGVYSDIAEFSSTAVATLPNRNVLFTDDIQGASFPEFKYKTTVDAALDNALEVVSDSSYGEYVGTFDLGGSLHARVTVQDSLEAVDGDDITWAQANFSWNSNQAARPWLVLGDLDSVIMERFFATYTGLASGDLEEFAFSGSLAGVGGTAPASTTGTPGYQAGRYANGVLMTAADALTYNVSIPSTFQVCFGARIQDMTIFAQMLELNGTSGNLKLYYDGPNKNFLLEGSDGIAVNVADFGLNTDDRLVISISQGATTRYLYIGRQDDAHYQGGTATAAPIGAFTSVLI